MRINIRFLRTEFDVDCCDVPFYESSGPLGPKIQTAIQQVFDGVNCPFFTHLSSDGATGVIVISNQELDAAQIQQAFEQWDEGVMDGEIDDDAVFEFEIE